MNNIIKRVWNQNRLVNIEDLTGMVFQAEDGGHTFEISGIDDTGAAVELSGTVAGVFVRPDNADIALTGSASGGVVSVTLDEDCYAVPGRFGLTIFVTSDDQKVAVYACVGTVSRTSTGGVAGDTPQDVVDLINAINAAISDLNSAIGQIPASYANVMAAIAPTYSGSALYSVGSYAWYNGSLYRCTTDITTAEAWTAAHWAAAVLGDDLKSQIDYLMAGTANLVVPKKSVTVNSVVFKDNAADGCSLTGKANNNGGRTYRLIEPVTLPAGTYYCCVYAEKETPSFMIENASGNTILKTMVYPNTPYSFTLESETTVYIGMNVTNEMVYNISGIYLYLSAEKPFLTPHQSAVDFVAREQARLVKDIKGSSLTTLKEYFPFAVGGYIANNDTISFSIRYRLVSAEKYISRNPIRVYMPTGYKYGIVTYTGDTPHDSGWLTGEHFIPADTAFIVSLARNPENTSEILVVPSKTDLYKYLEFAAVEEEKKPGVLSVQSIPTTNKWSQGACRVGDILVGYNASDDDHLTTNGRIYRYTVADGALTDLSQAYHNLGHCATADYMESLDMGVISTGTYTQGSQESVYFVKNMKSKIEAGDNITVSDADVIEVDFGGLDGVSCGVCFGESEQIIYVIKLESATQYDAQAEKYFYRAVLGQGANDLSGETGGMGTFISGCAAGEFNGTLKILDKITVDVYGELQGAKYRNGFLYMSSDSSHFDGQKTPYLIKIDLINKTAEYFKIPFYNPATGAEVTAEAEGFVFDGDCGFISVIGNNIYSIKRFISVL